MKLKERYFQATKGENIFCTTILNFSDDRSKLWLHVDEYDLHYLMIDGNHVISSETIRIIDSASGFKIFGIYSFNHYLYISTVNFSKSNLNNGNSYQILIFTATNNHDFLTIEFIQNFPVDYHPIDIQAFEIAANNDSSSSSNNRQNESFDDKSFIVMSADDLSIHVYEIGKETATGKLIEVTQTSELVSSQLSSYLQMKLIDAIPVKLKFHVYQHQIFSAVGCANGLLNWSMMPLGQLFYLKNLIEIYLYNFFVFLLNF